MNWTLVKLQSPKHQSDGAGGYHTEWQDYASVWGLRERYSGKHTRRDAQIRTFYEAQWRLRDVPPNLSVGDRIVDDDSYHQILAFESEIGLDQIVLTRAERTDGGIS